MVHELFRPTVPEVYQLKDTCKVFIDTFGGLEGVNEYFWGKANQSDAPKLASVLSPCWKWRR